MTSRLGLCAAAALSLLALAACSRSGEDAAFGQKVRAYLLAHPEVLEEAAARLQAKAQAQEAADERASAVALPAFRNAVERDPRDFVANPTGAITVTEFYDYRCPHCAHAAPAVLAIIHDRPDVRFVFKEMPIFGPTSEHAARVALAVKAAGGDYLGLYRAFMETRPLDDAAIDRIALRFGVNGDADSAAADRQIADTAALFEKLRLAGTPTFIVGDDIIPGEDMTALAQAISRARSTPPAGPRSA